LQCEANFKEIPEYDALDDEGRRAAFAKFVKKQKVIFLYSPLRSPLIFFRRSFEKLHLKTEHRQLVGNVKNVQRTSVKLTVKLDPKEVRIATVTEK
jgi:hypothetical protein